MRPLVRALRPIAIFAVLVCARARADTLVYYDPDANYQAIVAITSLYNAFFRTARIDLTFQPVQTRAAFEKLVGKESASFAIVSSEYLLKVSSPVKLTPLLVPSSAGDTSYRKLLVDRGSGDGRPDWSGKRIATTVVGANPLAARLAVLELLRRAGIRSSDVSVIMVSKDIDALMAISYGTVDAAVVSPGSLAVHRRIQPKAAAALRTVFQTDPILRSPLCIVANRASSARRDRVVEALRRMGKDKIGREAILSMGFDQWVPFDTGMLRL
jgi:ABC-type amino acid transport substrate-binding protein